MNNHSVFKKRFRSYKYVFLGYIQGIHEAIQSHITVCSGQYQNNSASVAVCCAFLIEGGSLDLALQ